MLTRLAQTSTAKILILIDALDEYELQDRVGDLANEIIWLSQLPNVKLCVSCRPWAIFTRRFEGFSVLHLDQLTYHDMEVYIEQRLLSTEEEANLCSTFHEGTVSSKSLIRQVAFAAEGVFLWVELVVNALCSEIRKGCPIEQLSLILSDFPTDLDDYFRDLIFGRIGNTRPNVSKTAAALKLAMVIQDGKDYSMNSNVGRMPISDDYLNFWLLSIGHLKPGFSWTDQMDPQLLASNDRYKLRQTKAFLEETCKDLLVVQERYESYRVAFLHRTVSDFLRDNSATLPIEEHAPGHFSDENFLLELLKLRCVSRLREGHMNCLSSQDLLGSIFLFLVLTPAAERDQSWLLTCQQLVLESFQTRCNCYGLDHMQTGAILCFRFGFYKYLFQAAQDMPHQTSRSLEFFPTTFLDLALSAPGNIGSHNFTVTSLLYQALGRGCDPNASLRRPSGRCKQTIWEEWLRSEYLRSQEYSQATRRETTAFSNGGASPGTTCEQIQENSSIIELLLRHGANPHCMPCVAADAHHKCSRKDLLDMLQFIVPTGCLIPVGNLLIDYSSRYKAYTLRRNQRRRAVRSFILSEQKLASRVPDSPPVLPSGSTDCWVEYQKNLLDGIINLGTSDVACSTWDPTDQAMEGSLGLIRWCIDCQSMSQACLSCPRPHILTQDAPCTTMPKPRIRQPNRHTTVTSCFRVWSLARQVWYRVSEWDPHNDPEKLSAIYRFLECEPGEVELTPEAAISVLKEWYAKNQIGSDCSQRRRLPRHSVTGRAEPRSIVNGRATCR